MSEEGVWINGKKMEGVKLESIKIEPSESSEAVKPAPILSGEMKFKVRIPFPYNLGGNWLRYLLQHFRPADWS